MKKVLCFGASSSKNSINKTFALYAANRLENIEIVAVDLNDFELPLYSIDTENEIGIPENAKKFYQLIQDVDAVIISMAEHNGFTSTAFKNLWDWMSRIPREIYMNIWHQRPMFLLSASPSKRTSNTVMKYCKELYPGFGANIIADFYLPSFNHYFADGNIVEAEYLEAFNQQKDIYQNYLDNN